MFKSPKIILLLAFMGLVLQSCSVKRFIPDGKLLYTGAEIELKSESEIKDLKEIKNLLETVLRPEPNSKFLGMRPGLYFHYKAQKENPGFINRFLNKKFGEAPVYVSDVETGEVEELMLNRLENSGFFYSEVQSEIIEKPQKKTGKAFYEAKIREPYLLETYQLDADSLFIYNDIEEVMAESPIKPGVRFDLTFMKLERERIDARLKEKGYYNFNPGFLIFEADTNQYENKRFDLFLRLKKDVPEKAIIPYKISEVNVYPNYSLESDSIPNNIIRLNEKNFIQEEEFFKPKRLEPYIVVEEGQFYSPDKSRNTARRLTGIGAYKFVNIRYEELDSLSNDSLGILEANIFLSPLKKRAIRAELQAVTKSNNFAGPHLAVTYANRNLFHGGEILNISGKVGYETQLSGGDQAGLHTFMLGAQTDLIFPRLLFPLKINEDRFNYSIPKTKISLGADYLKRSKLYSLGSLSAEFGYLWNANRFVTHEINPISVNYVRLSNTTEEFEEILANNPFLKSSFNQEFIAGLTYAFIYNGMLDPDKKHQFFANSTLDLAGNTLSLFTNKDNDPRTVSGFEYAQYAKADVDLRYHYKLKPEHTLATRIFAGLGLPYGNSETMPFSKQYFSGGPYSVRAFKIRSLGPGSFSPDPEENIAFFDQTGNVRLEANVEYRFPIYSFLKGAAFADAGNIWLTHEGVEGGKFGPDFLKELGIGVGVGLRVDIQNFVIRLDLAAPMRDPSLPEGERWIYDFGSPVLNFAIGYPF
ncbi:MAG TPA: BamA/TamA family outer membrane protein [Salinimicrobium sp.]|nr:BamA/TamA family outer membrane protein [Salinimicrobium sp.]